MAVDMNIMGNSVAPDMIRRTIRQWHGANQTNGETLSRKILNVAEDENMPPYRVEQNQFPVLVYHRDFRSHVVGDRPMDERTQAQFLKKARNKAELDALLKKGTWFLKPQSAMNDTPPAEFLPDDAEDFVSPYAMVATEEEMTVESEAPRRRGRPPGSAKHEPESAA